MHTFSELLIGHTLHYTDILLGLHGAPLYGHTLGLYSAPIQTYLLIPTCELVVIMETVTVEMEDKRTRCIHKNQ